MYVILKLGRNELQTGLDLGGKVKADRGPWSTAAQNRGMALEPAPFPNFPSFGNGAETCTQDQTQEIPH